MQYFASNLPLLKHSHVTKEDGDDKSLNITFKYCNVYVRCSGKGYNNSTLPFSMQILPLLDFSVKILIQKKIPSEAGKN